MTAQHRRFLWIVTVFLVLAGAGLVWIQPKHVSAQNKFGLADLRGRYVSAGLFPDTSQVSLMVGNGSTPPFWSSPQFDGAAEVMEADGRGNVFGESDITIGQPLPSRTRQFLHGQYTVDGDGRVVITTCPDAGTPTMIGTDNTLCPPAGNTSLTTLQTGYLQGFDGTVLATVSTTPAGPDSPNIKTHMWSKASVDIDRDDLLTKLRDHDKDDKDNKDKYHR